MIVEREAWRPLFLREPVAQRGWSLVTRGLRVYLLRVAEDDGTLLKRCADPFEVARNLTVHEAEADLVRGAIETLLQDGFLRWEGTLESPGWLGVDRLVTFGGDDAPAHAGASDAAAPAYPGETSTERQRRLSRERKERWKQRQQRSGERVPSVPEAVPDSVPGNVPERVLGHLPPQTPPSDRQINKNSGPREGVPGNVPGSVPRNVPERGTRNAVPPPDASGTRGYLRIDPQGDHIRYAKEHGLNLADIVERLRKDPRTQRLDTPGAWRLLTRWLKQAAEQRAEGAA